MTLEPWLLEVRALARDVFAAAHGRQKDLAAVTISVPGTHDSAAIAHALAQSLVPQGMTGVVVTTERGHGPTAIVALAFSR